MSFKVLWFDTETTGVDRQRHEMVQFAGIVEVDGKPVDAINIRMRPDRPEEVEPEALEKQGRTIDEMMIWPERSVGFQQLLKFLDKHVNRYDRADKMFAAGYNVGFDLDFLRLFFSEHGDEYMFSYLWWEHIDVMALAMVMKIGGMITSDRLRLIDVCEAIGVDFDDSDAHDAMYDIRKTRVCFYELDKRIKWDG